MHTNQRYQSRIVSFTLNERYDGSKGIKLKIERPVLFMFRPGQYALLRVSTLDNSWHPFTMASAPESRVIEFYIDVVVEGWTEQLWTMLKKYKSQEHLNIDLMGLYGTALVQSSSYTHVIAVGEDQQVIPYLSLLKQHVRSMLLSDPETFLSGIKQKEIETIR